MPLLMIKQLCEWDQKIFMSEEKVRNPWAHSTHGLTGRVPPQLTYWTDGPIKIYGQDSLQGQSPNECSIPHRPPAVT